MNILHLNTYTYKNNLSFPHYQFHKELLKEGKNSMILSAKGDVIEKEIILLNKGCVVPYFGISRFVRKFWFEIIKKDKLNYYYPEWNLDLITEKQIVSNLPFKPDVIIAYWTKFAFNQKIIYKLSKTFEAPVLRVMMDMAPITGGCHYACNCENYQRKCGKCIALNSNRGKDLSRITWEFKKKYIDKTDITLIASSSTLINQASKSSLYKEKKVEKLMLSVNENIFKPQNMNKAREILGIRKDKKVIFFGAASLKVKRKGLDYLIESLNILFGKRKTNYNNADVLLLIAGKGLGNIEIPFKHKYIGYLKTQNELAFAYQACDLFACPSIEDSGPIMIYQAIMSGRPVVSFDMGVSPDLVHSGETGYRAKLKDSKDFASGLDSILSMDGKRWVEISKNCRKLGLELFSSSKHTENLIKIIENVVKNFNKSEKKKKK